MKGSTIRIHVVEFASGMNKWWLYCSAPTSSETPPEPKRGRTEGEVQQSEERRLPYSETYNCRPVGFVRSRSTPLLTCSPQQKLPAQIFRAEFHPFLRRIMPGEGNPWEDLCEWVRGQGGSLANALGNLNNQGTYSDISSGEGDALQTTSSSSSSDAHSDKDDTGGGPPPAAGGIY
ncbi:hypothetical protein FOZ60_001742 [Perkinsus olseni]|uniref:Uncharacterized protein n=1 Tax=Perkinsus olseni TaxID=32597 RepID=A0A7J6NZP9_PEROL|nr:hypothetical protein FOZ60_001742 [Perkinsus olseni]